MMKLAFVFGVGVLLAGCAPYKVTVYGGSGASYVAPDLCAAELACAKAGESQCFSSGDTQTVTDPQTGKQTTTVAACLQVAPGNK